MLNDDAASALPVRLRSYKGPITDPTRWQSFRPRPDDIFICAPAKSGTTWMQAICAMLIFGRADPGVAPAKISPWLDANLVPAPQVAAMIEAQAHRRYFKTHTPLDGIPYYPQCRYVAVYRDPRDTFFSMMRLSLATERGRGGTAAHDLHKLFRMWLREPFVPGAGEQLSLAAVAHHFNGFWKHRALGNIHLVHYADLKRDLGAEVRAVARALSLPADGPLVADIARATEFSNMRRNAAQFAPAIGRARWTSESDFFRSGRNDQWRDAVDAADLAEYRMRLAALVPGEAGEWLERGGTEPSPEP